MNPATQLREVKYLAEKFQISLFQLYKMNQQSIKLRDAVAYTQQVKKNISIYEIDELTKMEAKEKLLAKEVAAKQKAEATPKKKHYPVQTSYVSNLPHKTGTTISDESINVLKVDETDQMSSLEEDD